MKIIIAGSRSISDYEILKTAIALSGFEISTVVSGHARGVDYLGELWARKNKIPVQIFLPDWNTYGKSAGIRRNIEMAKNADGLIALWDGRSKGTEHMIRIAKDYKLKVYVSQP